MVKKYAGNCERKAPGFSKIDYHCQKNRISPQNLGNTNFNNHLNVNLGLMYPLNFENLPSLIAKIYLYKSYNNKTRNQVI